METERLVEKMRANVARFGWHSLSVHPRDGESGSRFTYTIGLQASYGHPEIMIFDLDSGLSHGILTDCAALIKSGKSFQPDVEYPHILGNGYNVVFKKVRESYHREYFGAAVRFYEREPFAALVMFWPNKEHLFPWQEPVPTFQTEALQVVEADT